MRCTSYCIAESIDTESLVKYFKSKGSEPKYFDDVVHIQRELTSKSHFDVFIFDFGSVVFWGSQENEEKAFLEEFEKFAKGVLDDYTVDLIYYRIDKKSDKTFINEEDNEIVLEDSSEYLKLSISHALAQSVKLMVLEISVSKLLDKTAPIQQELAQKGSISLSKKEISKNIGMLFNERYSINLHSDILDTPEFFWRRPSYEPLYLATASFQDIQVRQNILNHRLDIIQELYSMLSNELNYKHSTRLEIIIILLITIEVLVALSHYGIIKKIFEFITGIF